MRFVTACSLLALLLGATLPVTAQPVLLDTDTRVPQGGGVPGDGYASAVALSADGQTAVVGAPASNGQEGAVHVFRNEGGTWMHQQRLSLTETPPAEGATGATFGEAVAVSADGSVIVVTAPLYRFDDGPVESGGAFAFERGGDGRWTKTADLLTENVPGSSVYYYVVALNDAGDRVVFSAATSDPATARTTPTVLTFERAGGTWAERPPAFATPADGDEFAFESAGTTIAMSADGQTVAIGNENLYGGDGATLLFDYDGTTWQSTGEVRVADASRFFSSSQVALDGDGDVLAVTDRGFDSFNGRVVVYTRSGDTWTEQVVLIPSDGGQSAGGQQEAFGTAIALRADGRALVTTAPFNFDFPTTFRGQVYFFANTDAGWVERERTTVLPAGEADECAPVGLSADGTTTLLGCGTSATASGQLTGIAVVLNGFAVASESDAPVTSALGLSVAPNPVASGYTASVRLDLDTASDLRAEVYDVLGRRVATLHDGPLQAGPQAFSMVMANRPAGLYIVRVTADGQPTATGRFTVVR